MLEVRLFGQFSIIHAGNPVALPSRPAQSLLAYLVLTPGIGHRREKLAGLFWPDTAEVNARNNLRHALWRIREALAGEPRQMSGTPLVSDKLSVSFERSPLCWVDAWTLQGELDPGAETEQWMSTLSAYGGDLLPGFYDGWVVLERERFQALFERKVQSLLDRLLVQERWSAAQEWAERWIALGLTPEAAYRALMIASDRVGDAHGVAVAFQRCRNALRNELGIEPSEATRTTYERLSAAGRVGISAEPLPPRRLDSMPSSGLHELFRAWEARHLEVLDLPSLAIVQIHPEPFNLDRGEARLVIASAVHHGLDLEPWLKRAPAPAFAAEALEAILGDYPRPQARQLIVDGLRSIEGPEADAVLIRLVLSDDSPRVRAEAAGEAARRGLADRLAPGLLRQLHTSEELPAHAALVAMADEVGIPGQARAFERLSIGFGLARKRWRASSLTIRRIAFRAALGGALGMAAYGATVPFYAALAYPDVFRQSLQWVGLAGWILSSALAGLIVGGLQGFASGAAGASAALILKGWQPGKWIVGALAGQVYAGYGIVFALARLLSPDALPIVFIPANVLYGMTLGAAWSICIPPPGAAIPAGRQAGRGALAAGLSALVTIPYVLVLYPSHALGTFASRLLFPLLFCLGMSLALSGRVDGGLSIEMG